MHLPASYDAWRLNPPEPRRPAVSTVQATFAIEVDGGLIETFATVDTEYGEIVSVKLGGLELSPEQVKQAIGADEYARQATLIDGQLDDLIREAEQDAADQYADWKYEQHRDA